LRNDTHREHVLRKLPRDIVDNRVRKQYRSFKPSFAKWRYETIHDVFLELLIRLPTLLLIQAAWFPNPQDKEELKNFLAAIAWKELWVFVRVAFEFGIKKWRSAADGGLCVLAVLTCTRRGSDHCARGQVVAYIRHASVFSLLQTTSESQYELLGSLIAATVLK
jgi:hypothetical protein